MSHVDEGTLHAYLDALERGADAGALSGAEQAQVQAHVAECASCAAALEEARGLRTRALAVLGTAAPVVELPPFEHVRAPARARAPRKRWVPLAWAASLVMAVGSGWMASELWRAGGIVPTGEQRRSVAERAESAARVPPAVETDLADAPAAAPSGGDASVQPETPVGAAAGAREQPAVANAAASARDALDAESAPAAPTEQRAAAPPQAGVEELSVRREERADEVTLQSRALEPMRQEPPAAPAPVALDRTMAESAQLKAGAVTQFAAAPRSASDTLAYAGDAPVEWIATSVSAAEAQIGAPLLVLRDARILEVATAEASVRVRQQLADGSIAEVVQWLQVEDAALESASREAADEGVMRVVRQGIAGDGRGWALLARRNRLVALKAPAGMEPLALLPRLR